MARILVTGGSGFFGGLLARRLAAEGHDCVVLDRLAPQDMPLRYVACDLRDRTAVDAAVADVKPQAIMHCAAVLAHGAHVDRADMWDSNVEGTRNLAAAARRHGVGSLVFTSSNCLWGRGLGRPVREDDPPEPVELYGRSKWAGEQALAEFASDLRIVTIRCPTIIDSGRLGLLTILFDFIRENRKVWVVGDGSNRYQFIYAQDLAAACIAAMGHAASDVFNIGSDGVTTLRAVYEAVIAAAGSRSRVASLPKGPTLFAMALAYRLRISPLGPYHYKMIAEDFVFDTAKIKAKLGWRPTMTNAEMLTRAYGYYAGNFDEIAGRQNVSTHRRRATMGVIRLLKWMS
jgi:nucleoside-diphosphate-sugar epimerase